MKSRFLPILKFVIRWGVAVAGVWWVVSQLTIRDRVNLVTDDLTVESVPLVEHAGENDSTFVIEDPLTGEARAVHASELVSRPDRTHVTAMIDGAPRRLELLGMQLEGDINRNPRVVRLLVMDENAGQGRWISPAQVPGGFDLKTPRPLVETGLGSMARTADPLKIAAAIAVFPITIIATSIRWRRLLEVMEIPLSLSRTLTLNMVGCFYNTFMLGSSGGDFVKAYYAAKQTPHKTRAVISVFVDRLLGLLTLVAMGGVMAGTQWLRSEDRTSPTAEACLQVAIGALGMSVAATIGAAILLSARLRRLLGLSRLYRILPLKGRLEKIRETAHLYRSRPWVVIWAMIVTIPVHLAVIVAAMLAGKAFGLPISTGYYFIIVPVIVLVGAVPISPQGAGVMEFFAVLLMSKQGATVSEALALTMSIRMVHLFWYLMGGFFVLRGGYSSPAHPEQALEGDADSTAAERAEPTPEA